MFSKLADKFIEVMPMVVISYFALVVYAPVIDRLFN